jgi:TM2 domain-containing membrane protein YozV
MLIEQRIANEKPSAGAAYLLCIFAGVLGAHRFYLGRKGSAIAMLILSITLVGLIVTAFWALIDLFLIPSMIKDKVDLARQKMILEAI